MIKIDGLLSAAWVITCILGSKHYTTIICNYYTARKLCRELNLAVWQSNVPCTATFKFGNCSNSAILGNAKFKQSQIFLATLVAVAFKVTIKKVVWSQLVLDIKGLGLMPSRDCADIVELMTQALHVREGIQHRQ